MPDWYFARDGQQSGPVTFDQIRTLCATGQVGAKDLVWTEGMPQWQAAGEIAAIFAPQQPVQSAPAPVAQAWAPPPYTATSTYQGGYYQPPSKHANLAMTSMILSLVSVACGGIFLAIPGAICGGIALKGMKQTGDYRNKGYALAGFWVGLGISILSLVIIVIYIIFIVAIVSSQH